MARHTDGLIVLFAKRRTPQGLLSCKEILGSTRRDELELQLMRTQISNEELNALPLGSFQGQVTIVNRPDKVPSVLKEVRENNVVGFDTESRPVFTKGKWHPVALIQIATMDKVFLLRLRHVGLSEGIISLLEDRQITKAGVGVMDDIHALQRMKSFTPAGFLDLARLSRDAGLETESIKKLTALLLGFRISKRSQTSNWDADVLTQKQISYAATDAWACLKIYEALHRMSPRDKSTH